MKENRIYIENGRNVYFTSDTHFGHKNIIKYCNRPFSSVEEMNETLIKNWNAVVPEDGIVFHLGDFGFTGSKELKDTISRLNGKKYLIIGNHDWKILSDGAINMFEDVKQQMTIKIEDYRIILNHCPMLCFAGAYGSMESVNKTWQLFGHVHSGPNSNTGLDHQRLINLFPTQYDVGVDNNDFKPVRFEDVKNIIWDQQLSLNMYRK